VLLVSFAGAIALWRWLPAGAVAISPWLSNEEDSYAGVYVPLDEDQLLREYYAWRSGVTSWRRQETIMVGSLTPHEAWANVVETRGDEVRHVYFTLKRAGRRWRIVSVQPGE